MDFIIFKMEPIADEYKQILFILGQPFFSFAMTNALINYDMNPRTNVTLINLVSKIESKPRIEWNHDPILFGSTNLGM